MLSLSNLKFICGDYVIINGARFEKGNLHRPCGQAMVDAESSRIRTGSLPFNDGRLIRTA
jgi:hypothetical protein